MFEFKEQLIKRSQYELKSPYTIGKISSVTIHNSTDNLSAKATASFINSSGYRQSYHIVIDDSEVIQVVPFNRSTNHVEGGNVKGNRTSLSVLICYGKANNEQFELAEENATIYVAKLLKEFNLTVKQIKPHKYWTESTSYNVTCPERTIQHWSDFVDKVSKLL